MFAAALLFASADDERWARTATTYSPGRTLGVYDGGELVATGTSFPSRMAVPGGAVLPMAAVTRVGVRADHTRRGLLTAMMHAQLADIAGRGEVLASLRASEARIYGRFGYGVATRGRDVRVRRAGSGWRAGAPAGGTVRLLAADEVEPVCRAVHAGMAVARTGGMVRPDLWWAMALRGLVAPDKHLLAAVHRGEGGDDGFVLAVVDGPGDDFTRRTLRVEDLHAADATATAGLWRFLLDVDLVGSVKAELRPLDEPLELMLADPRDCAVTAVGDEVWLRLVDVQAALAAREFGGEGSVLVAVHDPSLEANSGVYRIGGGPAERVGRLGGLEPDVECGVDGLAMAYLGDRAPSELAAAGWWRIPDPAARARADAVFATPTAPATPWCGTFF